ncbi:MAG: type II toxin-antitoxin system HicB family antitoxin [Spirochaetota bacterium]
MKLAFTYWQENDGKYLGYLNDFPDHWTQGEDLDDLKVHLNDLYQDFTNHQTPGIKRVGELEVV